ncbi:alpha/beta hydrolase [Kitasatospora sp. McL0602]|uniref:alpha/beta hydrolase n=1 Tax=Kitasatospora sp. McL0602 TaxID=3439530 RepID=UPI003F8A4A7A
MTESHNRLEGGEEDWRCLDVRQYVLAADGEKLACTVGQPALPPAGLSAVVLHGAGAADQHVHAQLARLLAERGCRSISLDFSGHGVSSGELRELSLRRRFDQACAVVEEFAGDTDQLVLVGASMSGQTVADLLARYGTRVVAVGLLAPAVYSRRAWDLPFGGGFTEVIRTPQAWRDSAALDAYAAFAGRAVLAVPAEDHVIPPAVNESLARALSTRADFTHLVLPEATHHLGRYFRAYPAECAQVADLLLGPSARPLSPSRQGGEQVAGGAVGPG